MEDYESYFKHAKLLTEVYAMPKEKIEPVMINKDKQQQSVNIFTFILLISRHYNYKIRKELLNLLNLLREIQWQQFKLNTLRIRISSQSKKTLMNNLVVKMHPKLINLIPFLQLRIKPNVQKKAKMILEGLHKNKKNYYQKIIRAKQI